MCGHKSTTVVCSMLSSFYVVYIKTDNINLICVVVFNYAPAKIMHFDKLKRDKICNMLIIKYVS